MKRRQDHGVALVHVDLFLVCFEYNDEDKHDSPFFFNTIGFQVPKRRVPAGDSATIEDVSEHCTVPLFYLVGRSRRDHVAN